MSGVEKRRSDFSLPVAVGQVFTTSPNSVLVNGSIFSNAGDLGGPSAEGALRIQGVRRASHVAASGTLPSHLPHDFL